MPLFEYHCDKCGLKFTSQLPVARRDVPVGTRCQMCDGKVYRGIGNSGGFRLGTKGSVSWSKGGYSSLLGDVVRAEG